MSVRLAALGLALLLTPAAQADNDAIPARANENSSFHCEGGQSLSMRFGTLNGESVAAVMAGGERHVLPLQPWTGGVPRITWSDGAHTLTWDVGVRIKWMDDAGDLFCGRRVHSR